MNISRRQFIQGAAALAACGLAPAAARAAEAASCELRAAPFRQQVFGGAGPETEVWGFNGSVPGPVLRYRQGERVRLELANALPEDTTIHWHGLRVPNAMDGVPFVTQRPVAPGGRFVYEFDLPDAGTFWYHPHQKSFEQVARGLYGAFIVEEARPIEVDREALWVLSDFKLGADGRQEADFGAIQDFATMGRLGNVITLNGRQAGAERLFELRAGERIRLRLVNAASARIFNLRFGGPRPVVIAYDGQAVEPHPLPADELRLGPGMRADLLLDCMGRPGERFAVSDTWHRNRDLATIVYRDERPLRSRPPGPAPALAPNPLPEPDLAKATRNYILFQGGMGGQPVIGLVNGRPVEIQELLGKHGLAWTMNFTARHEQALNHTPFLTLRRGEHCILTMVNQTSFEHPMHLHGQVFRVLAVDGRPTRYREWRDTVLIGPRETLDIAFVADSPGDWMFHCHILEHAAGGMMGTIRVG